MSIGDFGLGYTFCLQMVRWSILDIVHFSLPSWLARYEMREIVLTGHQTQLETNLKINKDE